MATYVYRCERCGPWEIWRPIGTAESAGPCPGCGAPGRRVYTAPLLNRAPKEVVLARSREEASRDAPQVTTAVPPAATRPLRGDPRWGRLPRP
jgi:putative FmdB family regulatory protein